MLLNLELTGLTNPFVIWYCGRDTNANEVMPAIAHVALNHVDVVTPITIRTTKLLGKITFNCSSSCWFISVIWWRSIRFATPYERHYRIKVSWCLLSWFVYLCETNLLVECGRRTDWIESHVANPQKHRISRFKLSNQTPWAISNCIYFHSLRV